VTFVESIIQTSVPFEVGCVTIVNMNYKISLDVVECSADNIDTLSAIKHNSKYVALTMK